MIDPQARPSRYIKLMVFVVVLGVICAVITITFMALVNLSTLRLWEEAAQTLGIDVRLFTLLVCTIGGLVVGLLVQGVRRSQCHLRRSDDRIRQDRALRLSSCPRHRDHRLRLAHLRRQPGAGSAAG